MGTKKGHKFSEQAVENMRQAQLKRWQRIRELMAHGEEHDTILNAVPRNCKHDDKSLLEKVADFITNLK
ncbi:hypothetical protein KX729_09325 [Rhizobium sp. XQZ8]|uniref:hypothetical protein n=1 Tax=Rhizobium populisoli TaxID=2859785 RepID=UPI001CA54BA3|nr:hypothetical protein [Rhizobium populisoli]MBW6421640.1 hypothetical protein [Rhizobium populisoli]